MAVERLAERYRDEVAAFNLKSTEPLQGYINRGIIPLFGDERVADIRPATLASGVRQYATEHGARTGDILRNHLRAMFGYAVELGIRHDNPMTHISRRVTGYKAAPRARVLTDDEIRLLFDTYHYCAAVLRFALLTGCRTVEIRNGYREGDRWMIPAEVSKNKRAHWVHLTATAAYQLPLMKPGLGRTDVAVWCKRFNKKHGIDPVFTAHDCRRTAATRMGEAGVAPHIIERVLNHKMQGVASVYQHQELEAERIEAAKILEAELLRVIGP